MPAGSSTQIGVLVVPFCVVLSWMMGQPLDLNFNEFEALVLFISVLLAAVVVQVSQYPYRIFLAVTAAKHQSVYTGMAPLVTGGRCCSSLVNPTGQVG